MKSEAKTALLNCLPVTPKVATAFRANSFRFPVSGFRFSFVLPLAFLLASWQFSGIASAKTAIISADIVSRSSIGGIDCVASENIASENIASENIASENIASENIASDNIAPENEKKQPPPEGNNSSDSTTDLDDSDVGLDDLSADNSTRNDQDFSHVSVADLDAVALRPPSIIRVPLLAVHCFYCLHEHIRERAPPSLA